MGHEHSIRRAPPRRAAPARGPAAAPPRRATSFSPAGLQRRFGDQEAGALLAQLSQGGAAAARRASSGGGCCDGRRLQAKLTIGPAHDRFDREADSVADRVMRMDGAKAAENGRTSLQAAGATVQRLCNHCEEDLRGRPLETRPSKAAASEPEVVRLRVDGAQSTQALDPETARSIQAMRGGGQPLPSRERAFFEPRFGRDFGSVRIHADAAADRSARAIGARAFTIGNDSFASLPIEEPIVRRMGDDGGLIRLC